MSKGSMLEEDDERFGIRISSARTQCSPFQTIIALNLDISMSLTGPVSMGQRKPFVPHRNPSICPTRPASHVHNINFNVANAVQSHLHHRRAPDILFSILSPRALDHTTSTRPHHECTNSGSYRITGLRVLWRRILPQRTLRETCSHPHT